MVDNNLSITKEDSIIEDFEERNDELDYLIGDPYMLTTIDNPFNPFTQYDDWYAFDVRNGYNSCAYLARIVKSSEELNDKDEFLAVQQAINDIVRLNVLGIYTKVKKESFVNRSEIVAFPTVSVTTEV